jgi:hypothetical protein
MNQAALKWLYMILIAAACGSADCAEPLGSSGTLVYQSGSGFFKRELSAKASALSPSRSLLSGQETVIYDWTSFVSAVANDAPKIGTADKGGGHTHLGSQWRASYQQMPTSSSQCRNVSDQDSKSRWSQLARRRL